MNMLFTMADARCQMEDSKYRVFQIIIITPRQFPQVMATAHARTNHLPAPPPQWIPVQLQPSACAKPVVQVASIYPRTQTSPLHPHQTHHHRHPFPQYPTATGNPPCLPFPHPRPPILLRTHLSLRPTQTHPSASPVPNRNPETHPSAPKARHGSKA